MPEQEEEIYYGVTTDLKHNPTMWSRYIADARSQALDMRDNPLWKSKPIYIIKKTVHYEIADCYNGDNKKNDPYEEDYIARFYNTAHDRILDR